MAYTISENEVELTAIRAQGPGGQHVNKSSNAVQLRFDVAASRLPAAVKIRLLALQDSRLTLQGVVIIKSQGSRSQEKNKAEALARLQALIAQAEHVPRVRRPTKPSFGSKERRLAGKAQRAKIKSGRAKIVP